MSCNEASSHARVTRVHPNLAGVRREEIRTLRDFGQVASNLAGSSLPPLRLPQRCNGLQIEEDTTTRSVPADPAGSCWLTCAPSAAFGSPHLPLARRPLPRPRRHRTSQDGASHRCLSEGARQRRLRDRRSPRSSHPYLLRLLPRPYQIGRAHV